MALARAVAFVGQQMVDSKTRSRDVLLKIELDDSNASSRKKKQAV